jgi:DNA processing protein
MEDLFSKDELEWCLKMGIRITQPGDDDYPKFLQEETYRPHYLTYWGHPVWNEKALLSVVGSRTPSHQALAWLERELARFLEYCDCAIISGGARGIDQRAHQMALRMDRPTVVFVPSGLANLYPDSLREWVEPIIAGGGAIVSQFRPNLRMQKGFFHARNRLIASIAPTTLAVEARRQSGTLLTAKHVMEIHHNLGVVPSFPNEAGLGGLDLLKDGAELIRDAEDLLTLAGFSKLINSKNQKDEVGHPGAQGRWHLS